MAGRPTSYKPEYCEAVEKHMAQGRAFETFAANIGVHRDSLYEWQKKHPAFSDSIKRGQALSYKYWESIGIAGATGKLKGFNAAVWIFTMKNKFKWRDSHEITSDPDNPVAIIPSVIFKLDNK